MRRRVPLVAFLGVLGLVGVSGLVSGSSAATAVSTHWGTAIEVPGMAALDTGLDVELHSVSCGAPGDCAAGGSYRTGSDTLHAFVVNETNGVWGSAVQVPGTASVQNPSDAYVSSVSCSAAGDCAAGGKYTDADGNFQAFVVSETSGLWGSAVEVPGTAAFNGSGGFGDAEVTSVSCVGAGECAAGGYNNGFADRNAFVVSETNGVWGTAVEIQSSTIHGNAAVSSVSCASAGDCTAGGYLDGAQGREAFVVSETNGVWGSAIEVPGTVALNTGNLAGVNSVSCPAVGDCAVGGYYTTPAAPNYSYDRAFVVSETNGVWGSAIEVPGTAGYKDAVTYAVSCGAAGDCAAGGTYANPADSLEYARAFVVSETNGVWGNALEVKGTQPPSPEDTQTGVSTISCPAAGECAAGGSYTDCYKRAYCDHAFLVSETNGIWGSAIEVPGTTTLNKGPAGTALSSVSCAAPGDCAAGGAYRGASDYRYAFVVNSTPGPALPQCVVPNVVGKALAAAKRALTSSHCGVGTAKRVYSRARKGRVIAQNPKPGRHLTNGSKVALTVSKGKRLSGKP